MGLIFMPRLSGKSAALYFSVRNFLQKDLRVDISGSKILLGFSHGADSTALLLILNFLRAEFDFELHSLHLDHGLRPESSLEAEKALDFCRKLNLPCRICRAEVASFAKERKVGLEEAGRELRFKFFEEERQNLGADWIALAHHREDLAEDLLLRLLRGSSWPSLAGMRAVDQARRILRPILLAAPEELKTFLLEQQAPWLEDPSNAENSFKRNRLRNTVMPLLKKENPSLSRKVVELWRQARDDEEHWRLYLEEAMRKHPPKRLEGEITLPKKLLGGLERAARMRLYAQTIYEIEAGQPLAETLFKMDDALINGRGKTIFQFPGSGRARVQKGEICFFRASQTVLS